MTDRISGAKGTPYGVQQTPEKPTADGRVRASRTHARQHGRVDSGAVDLASVQQRRSELEKVHKVVESEKVHELVTDLTKPDTEPADIAGKLKKLCKSFQIADLSDLFASKLEGLPPEARAKVEDKLGWAVVQLKSTDADAVKLVQSINATLAKLPKN
jgi:hypothetical protein